MARATLERSSSAAKRASERRRLVNEFLAEAATRRGDIPLVIAFGQCIDLGPIGAPFGPIRRVLRDLHAEVGTDALRSAAGSPAVIATLAALVPGIADDGEAGDERAGEFAEAIEVLFETLSTTRHLVVVIEDLQWADAATLALLKTFASTLRGRHLTIVATYRSDDVDRFHPLRPVLAELDRTRTIVRIEVGPLSPAEVAEQVGAPGERPGTSTMRPSRSSPTAAAASRSWLKSSSNWGTPACPTLSGNSSSPATRGWRDPAQQVVRAMAAGGMHVDHDVLAAVAGLEDHDLDVALREAIDARVVLADGAGYSFRHALTQEAVHGEMLPSERVRVHRRYAEHLGDNLADAPDDRLGGRRALAGRARPARRRSMRRSSPSRSRTRDTLPPPPSSSPSDSPSCGRRFPMRRAAPGRRCAQLHLDAAQAWHDLGEPARALRSANEGLALEPRRSAHAGRAAAPAFRRDLQHRAREPQRRPPDRHCAARRARRRPSPHPALRVLSNVAISGHGPEAADAVGRAIALAEDADDDAALAVALTIETWRIADDEDDEPRA